MLLIGDMFVAFLEMVISISAVLAWEHVFKHSPSRCPQLIQSDRCLPLLSFCVGVHGPVSKNASHGSSLHLVTGCQ